MCSSDLFPSHDMEATGDDIFILGTQDGTFAGDGLLNMNDNGDVVLTRYADSEEG